MKNLCKIKKSKKGFTLIEILVTIFVLGIGLIGALSFFNINLNNQFEAKQELIDKHGRHGTDTGSTDVQIAMLTKRINELTEHMRAHKKDHNTRRGLLKLVGQRRRFLNYLMRTNLEGYRALIKELGIRR